MSKSFNLVCFDMVCPMPVAKTKRKLNQMESGDVLEVKGDFLEAGENIKRFVEKNGHFVLDFKLDGENYYLKIKKG